MADESIGGLRAAVNAGKAESGLVADSIAGVLDELEEVAGRTLPVSRTDLENLRNQFTNFAQTFPEVVRESRTTAVAHADSAVQHYQALQGSARPDSDQLRASAAELKSRLQAWDPAARLQQTAEEFAAAATALLAKIDELLAATIAAEDEATEFMVQANSNVAAADAWLQNS